MGNFFDEVEDLALRIRPPKEIRIRVPGANVPETNDQAKKANVQPQKRMTSLIERLESFNGRPLKPSQLAKELGISTETVLRRAKKGIYPSFRQGRTVYFNPSALIRYFQSKGVK